jgi:hypothetical protein
MPQIKITRSTTLSSNDDYTEVSEKEVHCYTEESSAFGGGCKR